VTFLEAITSTAATLSEAGISTARLDAELLLCWVLKKDRAWLLAHLHDVIDFATAGALGAAVYRRSQREPLQYITGIQEFWGHAFFVTPDALIPRPETELIIESVLTILGKTDRRITIVDFGTGTGCIAVSLAHELLHARIVAIDISRSALTLAKKNAHLHGMEGRIRFLEGNLFDALHDPRMQGQVDVIVSNPPYIADRERDSLQPEVRDFEPATALFSGARGTEVHEKIILEAPDYLRRAGVLIMEMGAGQADALREMILKTHAYDQPEIARDLAGIERVVIARKK